MSPHPVIPGLHIRVDRSVYQYMSAKPPVQSRPMVVQGLADSGAQMTVMSPEMARSLGVQEHKLLPMDLAIFTSGGGGLTVISGIPLMMSLDVNGKQRETCHLAYVMK